KMKKKIITIIVIGSLLFGVGGYIIFGNHSNENEEAIKYSYANVSNGDISIDLMYDGQIEIPIDEYSFDISGEIGNINVEIYQDVKAGEVLATLDTKDIENELNEAKLNLESSIFTMEKNIASYNKDVINYNYQLNSLYESYETLKSTYEDMKLLSDAYPLKDIEEAYRDYNNALDAYENYKLVNKPVSTEESDLISVKKAENTVLELEEELTDVTIKSLTNGSVIEINVTEKEKIATSKVAFKVEEKGKAYVTTKLQEIDILSVFEDQKAYIEIEAMPGEEMEAKVININRDPFVDSNGIVTYEVELELIDINEDLMDGMTASTTFIILEKLDVLKIPNKAVKIVEAKQVVNVVTGENSAKQVEIITGLTDGRFVEVLSGLNVGDRLVYEE
ncbi:efflux RND transporter periplasmic adaptor subunit, partial [Clostridiaceae bacterium HSG29]|nr:efflux RND transporter periplasmic adaptor subunit [Clostridiaceae bacterium HSG29]